MKFCSKCGNQMEDDMMFCQKCGTKAVSMTESKSEDVVIERKEQTYSQPAPTFSSPTVKKDVSVTRKGMKVGATICFVFGVIYALISLMEFAIFGMALFCFILGAMFICLSKTPKGSEFVFGKDKGIKKNVFVIACIAVAFISFGAIMSTMETPTETNTPASVQTQNDESSNSDEEVQKQVSLADVEKWYKNEMPTVSQNLIEYANNVKGISNINVTKSEFRFGEDDGWYDCHYTYLFTCKVNGEKCMGEARAFRKYNDSNIEWFHFEIAKDSDWSTVVEEYDESSDATIENYYKELVSQYK